MTALRSARQRIHRAAFHVVRAALRTTGSLPVPPLFILAHMRSGSTLLTHLLLTNPHIMGGGESHTTYHSPDDFDRLCLWTRWLNRTPLRPVRYVADQIVHDDFTPGLMLLRQPQVRSLFLVREPQGSIASLVRFTSAVKRP